MSFLNDFEARIGSVFGAAQGYTEPFSFKKLAKRAAREMENETYEIDGVDTAPALYTVLVEGDDMTEPVADETRSILDGHIVLSRKLASKGHYPAIDVNQSVSRLMNSIVTKEQKKNAQRLRQILAKYAEVELLVQIGEYKKGADPAADDAIAHVDRVNAFLKQGLGEKSTFEETVAALEAAVK